MDEQKVQLFFRRISTKLAVLLGSSVAFSNSASLIASPSLSASTDNNSRVLEPGKIRSMPNKLVLKKTTNGFKMIAQHSSHASHASHASHGSHASHASHASHNSHASHGSHASHSSHSSRAI
jgi:hypothetical protein